MLKRTKLNFGIQCSWIIFILFFFYFFKILKLFCLKSNTFGHKVEFDSSRSRWTILYWTRSRKRRRRRRISGMRATTTTIVTKSVWKYQHDGKPQNHHFIFRVSWINTRIFFFYSYSITLSLLLVVYLLLVSCTLWGKKVSRTI